MKTFKYDEHLSWLSSIKSLLGNDIRRESRGTYSGLDKKVVNEFLSQFDFIRGYHGCRPENIGSYYSEGLVPLCAETANSWVRAFFAKKYPEVEEKIITDAIESSRSGLDVREGRAYFELDRKTLVDGCEDYFRYGSEYILGIFGDIESATRYSFKESLQEIGQPTVFICDIPFNLIPNYTVDLARCLIGEACDENRNGHYRRKGSDFGFSIYKTLPAELIIEHYHPENMVNPL